MVNVVEVLRRKNLTDIETVLVVVSMCQAGMIDRQAAMPVITELLGDKAMQAIRKANQLMDDKEILEIVEEFENERGSGKPKA